MKINVKYIPTYQWVFVWSAALQREVEELGW